MALYINNEQLQDAVIEQEFSMLCQRYSAELPPEELQANRDRIMSDARENAIERLILIQEARKIVPDPTEEEVNQRIFQIQEAYGGQERFGKMTDEDKAKFRTGMSDSIKLERYFEIICRDVPSPSEEECLKYYQDHKEEFKTVEMVRASHIVRRPLAGQKMPDFYKSMREIRQKLVEGADFATLSGQYSQCKDSGGDLGWFARGQMVPLFEDIVFSMKPGEVSDVFQTEFGFHIAKLTDRRLPEYVDYKEVQESIREHLSSELKNAEIGKTVDKLRTTTVIEDRG